MAVNRSTLACSLAISLGFFICWCITLGLYVSPPQPQHAESWITTEVCVVSNATVEFEHVDTIDYAQVSWCLTLAALSFTRCGVYAAWSSAVNTQLVTYQSLLPLLSNDSNTTTTTTPIEVPCLYSAASPASTLRTSPIVGDDDSERRRRASSLLALMIVFLLLWLAPLVFWLIYFVHWFFYAQHGHVRRHDDEYRSTTTTVHVGGGGGNYPPTLHE
jgi:hypothetical protein